MRVKNNAKGIDELIGSIPGLCLERIVVEATGGYESLLIERLVGAGLPGSLVHPARGGDAEIAILNIGMNTLDLYAIQNWKVASRFVGGGKLGIHRLFGNMNPSGRDLEELDSALRAGTLQSAVEQKTVWLGAIMGNIERTWSSLRRFDLSSRPAGVRSFWSSCCVHR